ncbi:MAG: DUF2130 domain-containing protein [Patescibacteria group bacterium]|nr:DUF2130 domain-containing protein [Patescibacteria group bacterium]
MNDQIICPYCKHTIPLTEALSHQIQEKYQKFYRQRLAEEKTKIEEALKEEIGRKLKSEVELELKDKSNEVEELRKQNKSLSDQLLEINKLMRTLKSENEQSRLEMEKRIANQEEKIRLEENKRANEEYKLKILEKDKKLDDALKMVEEYKRKLEQGSQQLQGEVLELELENILKREYPYDEILPVAKGVRGADVLQKVRANNGRDCGAIVWESKRTKAWNNDWIVKLKEDQREAKAEIAVIITQILPDGINNFGIINNVWVGNFESVYGLSLVLRRSLLEITSAKYANINRQSKMDILYKYFTGVEFKQRLEAVLESYDAMKDDLEKEKRWFTLKWAKQDKNIRKVFDNLSGMYGDLQGMLGRSLPDVKGLDMLPSPDEKSADQTNLDF